MRQFDLVHSAPIALPVAAFVTIEGPAYKMTAQSQILRFLFSRFRITQLGPEGGDIQGAVFEAYMSVIPNPVSDETSTGPRKNSPIICPFKYGDMLNQGDFIVGLPFNHNGGALSCSFDMDNVDVRGDDFPNLGGLTIAQAGNTTAVSVKTRFHFYMEGAPDSVFDFYFSVLADISDFSQSLIRR